METIACGGCAPPVIAAAKTPAAVLADLREAINTEYMDIRARKKLSAIADDLAKSIGEG